MLESIEIYLIRHGESESNILAHLIGGKSIDANLTEKGVWQAHRLGERFRREGIYFDGVFSSTYIRAKRTAAISLEYIGFPQEEIVEAEELVEQSQGDWEGEVRAQIYKPRVLVAMNQQGKFFIPPSGESQRMTERRASNYVEDHILYNPEFHGRPVKVAIFNHGQVTRSLLHYAMGFNDRLIHRVVIENTSISRLKFDQAGWAVGCINDTAHLNTEERR